MSDPIQNKNGLNNYLVDDSFDIAMFQSLLTTQNIGRQIVYYSTTTSTMDLAEKQDNLNCTTGLLLLANEQTKGIGTVERKWFSPAGLNIYSTTILYPKCVEDAKNVTILAALAVIRTLTSLGIKAVFKWPNDVLINNRKVSGVLCRASVLTNKVAVFVGIGINVNQKDFDPLLGDAVATSISCALGVTELKRERVLASLCNEFEDLLSSNWQDVLVEYRNYDMLTGNRIYVMPKRGNPDRRLALALGIDEEGHLLVRFEDSGEERALISEEVSIRSS